MIGTSVDRYKIVEELGHGGMSVVYRGIDTSLERDVAVKVLHHHLARKADSRQRFHREAKAIARLKHPNILDVYDFSSEDAEKSYIVMEFVRGDNLRDFLAKHGHGAPEAAALVGLAICAALSAAHEQGIIHRDLKPENIMVSYGGELKLMDFGIAHVIDAETMTQTGALMGSPAHMSPEMIEGERVDARADVFALGTVLYWLSTGALPFDGQNAPQVLKRVLSGEYEKPVARDARVGRTFQAIVEKCMAHDPEERYQSAREVSRELGSFLATMGIDSPDLELRKYLVDPKAWSQRWTADVVARLVDLGHAAVGRDDVPAAVGFLDRALAYDPGNAEVQACLAQIHQRSRVRIFGAVAVAVVLLAVFWSAVEFSPTVPDAPTPDVPVVAATATQPLELPTAAVAERIANGQAEAAASAAASAVALDVASSARNWAEARTRFVAAVARPIIPVVIADAKPPVDDPTPKATYTYAFRVVPPAAQLVVGSRTYSSFEAAKGIELTEGVYPLTATSRGCKRLRQTLEVKGPQRERQDVVLEWEDGTVRVQADVAALVFIGDDTRNVARRLSAGQGATFKFPFGSSEGENQKRTTFHIAPASDMTKRQTYSVVVRPGTVETINVAFRNR